MTGIRYSESMVGITSENLEGFFVGWPKKPTAETLLRLLRHSSHRVIALDGGKVVGFVTAIADGVLAAYMPFLEVLPEYQGKGIGTELVQRMLKRLNGFYMIDAVCDAELQTFYEKCGMRKAVGMTIRNYERQGGK